MKDIKAQIQKYIDLLPVAKSVSQVEAERRSGEFLVAMSMLTDLKHGFSEDKIRRLSAQTAVYAEELAKGTAKTVTENKTTAEASAAYTDAREQFEFSENDISYLRAYYDIFNNAHVFYRQLAKGENN